MAKLVYHNIVIKALAACVPSKVEKNIDLQDVISLDEIKKLSDSTGIYERRVVTGDICTSDLCQAAAERIFSETNISKDSIDMLIFVSQTSDYRLPATSCILQNKLGLPQTVGALDINLGCTGFVYGLSSAFAFAQTEGINRVLLCVGDTISKITNRSDHSSTPLFGDCGTACIIEKDNNASDSYFVLNTDGGGESAIKVQAGIRNPITKDSFIEKEDENHNKRNDLQLYMDGMEVFNFTIRCVSKSVRETICFANTTMDDINYFVFHQSNKFMMDYFCKKLKIDGKKLLYSIENFGNTSSASIPLTLITNSSNLETKNSIVLCGYGVGLSWATCVVSLNNCSMLPLIEI